jgi:hypothetical protein
MVRSAVKVVLRARPGQDQSNIAFAGDGKVGALQVVPSKPQTSQHGHMQAQKLFLHRRLLA